MMIHCCMFYDTQLLSLLESPRAAHSTSGHCFLVTVVAVTVLCTFLPFLLFCAHTAYCKQLLSLLMPALLSKWSSVTPDDRHMFSLLECLASITHALQQHIKVPTDYLMLMVLQLFTPTNSMQQYVQHDTRIVHFIYLVCLDDSECHYNRHAVYCNDG
jgi:hypothetical protein